MSHYHCEIVIPPTAEADLESAIGKILAPFDENADEETRSGSGFWDFWVIGGRWAGEKIRASCEPALLERFWSWAKEQKIMVSGLVCGKESIVSAEQRAAVDAMWSEMFPQFRGPCPFFKHANDQYDSKSRLPLDVCKLSEVPVGLTCSRFILANVENGVTWQDCKWRGSFAEAMAEAKEKMSGYREEWREKNAPTEDWLVVTVDYHS